MNAKKIVALIAVLAMLMLSLSGCGSDTKAPAATTAPTEAPTEAPAEAEATEAAEVNDPYAQQAAADPYAQQAEAADPYAQQANADPYAQQANADPYAQQAEANDPYAQQANADPYAQQAEANDPYAQQAEANDPYAQQAEAADPYAQQAEAADPYAQQAETTEVAAEATEEPVVVAEEYIPTPSADAKYTVEVTADGWVKVVNEGGATLGLSSKSGVKIVEVEGLAFKDMNQNGELDAYEDWRLPTEERTANLVAQMQGVERALILSHGGWGNFTTEPLAEDDGSYTYLVAGGRGGVTRNISQGGAAHAKWTNQIQAVAESCYYGIPAMISIDPANISGLIECVSLASTMDVELAAEIGKETAKEYRAAGVTALLGPQTDISSPIMSRAGGTYGEDPQLTLDITTNYVNAMQSTYDENGNDLGWGPESVYCFTKHYGGAGTTEGGRDDHHVSARYAIFPGDNLEAHLITFFDGVFNLPGKTGTSGIMTQYSINVDAEGNPYGGEEISGAYNPYMYGLLDFGGYHGLTITDWGVYSFAGIWGAEALEEADRIAYSWERGANLLGGYGTQETVAAAYDKLIARVGQEKADEILSNAASKYISVMMNLGMFDQPYNDSAYADTVCYSEASNAFGASTQEQSVVMIKNNGVIAQQSEATEEKKTAYIPYEWADGHGVSWFTGIVAPAEVPTWAPSMDLEVMAKYFNVITDTVNEDGTVTRATAEELAAADFALVGMSGAYSMSYPELYAGAFGYLGEFANGNAAADQVWYPTSLQYEAYTADTAAEVSVGGMIRADGSKQNRSYKGQTMPKAANYGDLEALQYAKEAMGDKPVIVSMKMDRGMVWSEVEPLADAILVCYNKQYNDAVAKIILGQLEPQGLLVFQQPKSMEAVEAQLSDVPRDMECYVDANGNTYDFAFGLNWAGVIADERVERYSKPAINKIMSIDYDAYKALWAPAADVVEEAPVEETVEETTEETPAEEAPAEETTEETEAPETNG